MARPIIFLAFANNRNQPQLDLEREDDQVYDLFDSVKEAEGFEMHRDSFTSSQDLIDKLYKYRNQVSIFHFGGHSGNANLYLTDKVAKSAGVSGLIGDLKYVKCVFLNGCHTREFVDTLLAGGVPVVIATDRAVENKNAEMLAIQFYTRLKDGDSILDAFDGAKDAVKTTSDREIVLRSSGWLRPADEETSPETFPWGLYYNKVKDLEWRLSRAKIDVLGNVTKSVFIFLFYFLVLFGLLSWANWNFGTGTTSTILGLTVFSAIGIGSFITRFFKSVNPVINYITEGLSNFLLRIPVLITVGLLTLGVMLSGSSVVIDHAEPDDPEIQITNDQQANVPHWKIRSDQPNQSRIFLISTPFGRRKVLHVDGYQPHDLDIKPVWVSRIRSQDLLAKAALLIRLPVPDIQQAAKISLRIERADGSRIPIKSVDNPSVCLGPERPIQQRHVEKWKKELKSRGLRKEEHLNKYSDRWTERKQIFHDISFIPGETLFISKIMHDSVFFTKQVVIQNQKLNDILLEN